MTCCPKVKNVLYKLDRNLLSEKSGFFASMFSLPVPAGCSTREGDSDNNPIRVPVGITPDEFDSLIIACLDVEWSEPPYPIQRCRDILKLATLWDFPPWTIEMAVFNLQKYDMVEFPPAERLYLARLYNIPKFVGPAVEELCKREPRRELAKLTSSDIQQIGLSAFEVIAKVREAIQKDRRWIAFHAPKLENAQQDPMCSVKKHTLCEMAWKKAWWSQIGRQILQPADQVALKLERYGEDAINNISAPDMTPGCLASIKKWVIDEGRFKVLEQSRVDMGISEVLRRLEKGDL